MKVLELLETYQKKIGSENSSSICKKAYEKLYNQFLVRELDVTYTHKFEKWSPSTNELPSFLVDAVNAIYEKNTDEGLFLITLFTL